MEEELSSAPAVLSHDASPLVNSRDGDDATTTTEMNGRRDGSPSLNNDGARTMTTATTYSSAPSTPTSNSGPDTSKDVSGDTSNGSEESGYGSDSSPETPNGDLTDSSSSYGYRVLGVGTGDLDDDDDTDDDAASDDMQDKIYFLREKQQILERASSVLSRRPENSYAAAMASELCRGLTSESSGSSSSDDDGKKTDPNRINIWNEARRVLSVINKRGGGGDESSGRTLPVPTQVVRKRCAPNPMNPLIDTRIVNMVRSKQYESGNEDSDSDTGPEGAVPGLSFTGSNQWLTKALLWSNSGGSGSATNPTRGGATAALTGGQGGTSWSLTTDPFTHAYGLVPPPTMSMDDAVDLQDVINVSDEPRVVTQSSPPFCVVHVNRAFLELADLPGHDSLVGKPVETIFRIADFVDADVATSTSSNSIDEVHEQGPRPDSPVLPNRYMIGTVQVGRSCGGTSGSLTCRLRVLPVVDRSRRRRLRNGDPTTTCSYQCMSHILIQVEATKPGQELSSSPYVSAPTSRQDSSTATGGPPPAPPCHAVSGTSGVIG